MAEAVTLKKHNEAPYGEICGTISEGGTVLYTSCPGSGKSYIVLKYLQDHPAKALIICPKRTIADEWIRMGRKYGVGLDTMTYQLLMRKNEAELDRILASYGCFVFDESHHVGAEKWGKNCAWIRDHAGNRPVFGLTATPVRYTDGCRDVGEEFFGGSVVEGVSQLKAVDEGILAGFDYVCGVFGLPDRVKKAKDATEEGSRIYEKIRHLEYCTENRKGVYEAFDAFLPEGGRKGIVFVDRIENLPEATGLMRGYFGEKEPMHVIHSLQSGRKNREEMDSFGNAERGWLFSVDMLNEGVHVPGVDTIVMLRKTVSPAVYIQQIGRGQAAGAGRTVIFDFIGNRNSLETSGFTPSMERGSTKMTYKPDPRIIIDYHETEAAALLTEIYGMLDEQVRLSHPFTEEEDAFLLENYREHGAKWCSEQEEMAGRSAASCWHRAAMLGLAERHKRYTEDDKEFLRENYGKLGPAECAHALGRSEWSCTHKAYELGLTGKNEFTAEDDAIMRENYASKGPAWCAEKTGHPAGSVAAHAKNVLGLSVMRAKWSSEEDAYLMAHYTEDPEGCAGRLGRSKSACATRIAKLRARAGQLQDGKKGTRFSEEELSFIRENYEEHGPTYCAGRLGRSVTGCIEKAKGMGLSYSGRRRWTEEENRFLSEHIDDLSLCIKELGRSREQCVSHAHYIGLR